MPKFTGTNQTDYIVPGYISAGVMADPAGTLPGDAADTIFGYKGADYVDGGGGSDWLYGGEGQDSLFGGTGDDVLSNYTASGNGGNDSMDGGAGNDTLIGTSGNETLLGGTGDDSLDGGSGSDVLDGGTGADTMHGSYYSTIYYVENVEDVVLHENGGGTIYSNVSYALTGGAQALTLTGTSALDGTGDDEANVINGNSAANRLSGLGGYDTIYGGAGSDTIDGGANHDSLEGGGGNDSLIGGEGNDLLHGGAGRDTIVGGNGDDVYYIDDSDATDVLVETGSGGRDAVFATVDAILSANIEEMHLSAGVTGYGNSLGNRMDAGIYNGMVFGLGGSDTLRGGWEGVATLAGGVGDDFYYVHGAQDTIIEAAGEGVDTLNLDLSYSDDDAYVLADNVENLNVQDDYYFPYDYYSSSPVYLDSVITANAAANVVEGGAGANTIRGLDGADILYGNAGSDTFDGGGGKDYVDGGSGRDTVLYTSNTTPVRVDLAAGLVSFPGKPWPAETVVSIENAHGGSGNDIFIGVAWDNSFLGNGGNDTFDGGGGHDYFDGGAGSDTMFYTAASARVSVNLAAGTASAWDGSSASFISIENASTGSAADTLTGSSAANELHGMGGTDRLIGAGGADRLVGGAGNDVFVFAANSSTPGARDVIAAGDGATAFQGAGAAAGDRFDLSGYDADTTRAGVQDWAFGTSHAKGHLWVTTSGSQTILNGNVDNDAAIEFQVAIDDAGVAASAYKVQDFIL